MCHFNKCLCNCQKNKQYSDPKKVETFGTESVLVRAESWTEKLNRNFNKRGSQYFTIQGVYIKGVLGFDTEMSVMYEENRNGNGNDYEQLASECLDQFDDFVWDSRSNME